jgi:hypothetical protein
VQPLARIPDKFREPTLDVEVDILEFQRPAEDVVPDLLVNRLEPSRMLFRSSAERMPACASMSAWAREPRMSAAASRWSKSTEAVYA